VVDLAALVNAHLEPAGLAPSQARAGKLPEPGASR
jgi:hypothetical protein